MGSNQSQFGPGMVAADEGAFCPTGGGDAFQRFGVALPALLRSSCKSDVAWGCGRAERRRAGERAQTRVAVFMA